MIQRVVHTVPLIGISSGGLATAVGGLLSELNRVENKNGRETVCGLYSFAPEADDTPAVKSGSEWFHPIKADTITPVGFSQNMKRALSDEIASGAALFHTHGMWQYTNHLTCKLARQSHTPYILSPHGMLFPQALQTGRYRKRLSLSIWFDSDLRGAAALHATSTLELRYLRELGFRGPVAVIPNVVQSPVPRIISDKLPRKDGGLTVGYIGRLHPRKQVENILRSVSLIPNINIRLFIIGSGDNNYKKFLKAEAVRLGISGRVEFREFLTGDAKWHAISECDVTVLPSDMENFGMTVAESLLAGVPPFAPAASPWQILENDHYGWCREPSPQNIADVLSKAAAMGRVKLEKMGQNGRQWALSQFGGKKIAGQMYELYDWVLGNTSSVPSFVDI